MKRCIPGLSATAADSQAAIPDGLFLVRVEEATRSWHTQKPFYGVRCSVVEPKQFTGLPILGRLYCTPKAMWKLGWFLRDFLYDQELLSQDELDERALRGLTGVVKITHTVRNGIALVNFEGFAPASQWEELSTSICVPPQASGEAAGKGRAAL